MSRIRKILEEVNKIVLKENALQNKVVSDILKEFQRLNKISNPSKGLKVSKSTRKDYDVLLTFDFANINSDLSPNDYLWDGELSVIENGSSYTINAYINPVGGHSGERTFKSAKDYVKYISEYEIYYEDD
jgi:hypothetical protein